MRRDGIDEPIHEVVELAAIEELKVLYHERERDLRSVLKLARVAAIHALQRRATLIEAREVRAVVAGMARSTN
jgi:hypothetical protein